MILSKEDRDRFADYLQSEAEELEKTIAKLRTMPTGGVLAAQLSAEADAARTTARRLRSTDESPFQTKRGSR